jgi:hypothetical protein
MNIPIIINNFNRLITLSRLCDDLSGRGYNNIHILDNSSTLPGLLEFYNSQESKYKIHRLTENYNSHAIWDAGIINQFQDQEWIVYTDSDIILNPNTPKTFIEQLMLTAKKYSSNKVGLALRIDNLPETFYGGKVRLWEKRFWDKNKQLERDVYDSEIDTTFAIIKPKEPFFYNAIRMAGDFTAEHYPWYVDFSCLDEEEKYFLEHSSGNSTYKRVYNEWKLL